MSPDTARVAELPVPDEARWRVEEPDNGRRYREESDLHVPPRCEQWGMHIQWAKRGLP